jgi:hypothetical protein
VPLPPDRISPFSGCMDGEPTVAGWIEAAVSPP